MLAFSTKLINETVNECVDAHAIRNRCGPDSQPSLESFDSYREDASVVQVKTHASSAKCFTPVKTLATWLQTEWRCMCVGSLKAERERSAVALQSRAPRTVLDRDADGAEYKSWWQKLDVVLVDEAHFMKHNYVQDYVVTMSGPFGRGFVSFRFVSEAPKLDHTHLFGARLHDLRGVRRGWGVICKSIYIYICICVYVYIILQQTGFGK